MSGLTNLLIFKSRLKVLTKKTCKIKLLRIYKLKKTFSNLIKIEILILAQIFGKEGRLAQFLTIHKTVIYTNLMIVVQE